MSFEPMLYGLIIFALIITLYAQNRKIKQLQAKIQTLQITSQSGVDQRLLYLRENLAHLDKVKAIAALREQYPELSLVQAVKLWEQK